MRLTPLSSIEWAEKYRPKTLKECVLPDALRKTLFSYRDSGFVPHSIFVGPSGMGKTTAAVALMNDIGADYLLINGSLRGNIDTLRNEILTFASTSSIGGNLSGSRKYVILDEADYVNQQSTQPSLRNFMEQYASACGFILTCNYLSRIIPPLQSRCTILDFAHPKDEVTAMQTEYYKRVRAVLSHGESVEFDPKVIAHLVRHYYPDLRKIFNEVQKLALEGPIRAIPANGKDSQKAIAELVTILKAKNFVKLREWVRRCPDTPQETMRAIYADCEKYVVSDSIPELILLIGLYQYRNALVADQEINLVAFLVEIMMSIRWV